MSVTLGGSIVFWRDAALLEEILGFFYVVLGRFRFMRGRADVGVS